MTTNTNFPTAYPSDTATNATQSIDLTDHLDSLSLAHEYITWLQTLICDISKGLVNNPSLHSLSTKAFIAQHLADDFLNSIQQDITKLGGNV